MWLYYPITFSTFRGVASQGAHGAQAPPFYPRLYTKCTWISSWALQLTIAMKLIDTCMYNYTIYHYFGTLITKILISMLQKSGFSQSLSSAWQNTIMHGYLTNQAESNIRNWIIGACSIISVSFILSACMLRLFDSNWSAFQGIDSANLFYFIRVIFITDILELIQLCFILWAS